VWKFLWAVCSSALTLTINSVELSIAVQSCLVQEALQGIRDGAQCGVVFADPGAPIGEGNYCLLMYLIFLRLCLKLGRNPRESVSIAFLRIDGRKVGEHRS